MGNDIPAAIIILPTTIITFGIEVSSAPKRKADPSISLKADTGQSQFLVKRFFNEFLRLAGIMMVDSPTEITKTATNKTMRYINSILT